MYDGMQTQSNIKDILDIMQRDDMELTVGKWGNSLAIRLPVAMRDDLGISENSKVNLSKTADGWTIKPITPLPRYVLADLVAKISPDNLPDVPEDEPVGKEVW